MDSSDVSNTNINQENREKELSDEIQETSNVQDAEEDQDEEEFLIMADIGHDIDQRTVIEHATKSEIHAIDIAGTNPFLQIGPYTFQGQYSYVLGTNLFFSTTPTSNDETSSINDDCQTASVPTTNHDLNYIGLSDKKLNLSRVYIYPKKQEGPPSNS